MSNRSEVGSIHLLNEPNEWEQVFTSLNYQHVTGVDIYLGLCLSDQSEDGCMQQQWHESIMGVIDTLNHTYSLSITMMLEMGFLIVWLME